MIFDCSVLKTEKAFHKNCFEFDSGANVASGEILKNVGEWMKSLNTGKLSQRHQDHNATYVAPAGFQPQIM